MSESMPSKLLWGIDGGGTKTTILLAEESANREIHLIGSVRAGSSNVNSRPWAEITAELSATMQSMLESASRGGQSAEALVAAFAGVGSPTVRDQWHEWFVSQKLAHHVQIVDDGAPLVAAGLPEGWGVVLIVGTGSAAFGRSASGQTERAGGWGYLIGDEGSGFAIGQAALRYMSKAYDRGEEQAPVFAAIEKKWSLEAPRAIVDRVHRSPEPRQKIAEIAGLVSDFAESGDTIAQEILQKAASELVSLIEIVASKLGWTSTEFPLAFSGGIAFHSAFLRQEIQNSLSNRGLRAAPISIVEEPACGCLELARQLSSS